MRMLSFMMQDHQDPQHLQDDQGGRLRIAGRGYGDAEEIGGFFGERPTRSGTRGAYGNLSTPSVGPARGASGLLRTRSVHGDAPTQSRPTARVPRTSEARRRPRWPTDAQDSQDGHVQTVAILAKSGHLGHTEATQRIWLSDLESPADGAVSGDIERIHPACSLAIWLSDQRIASARSWVVPHSPSGGRMGNPGAGKGMRGGRDRLQVTGKRRQMG
jgi:hypothetical protein